MKAGVEAVAGLVRNDVITMEALVKEMELYLTTTDDTVRARGILFLAEILDRLLSKALDKFTLSSLVRFFSSRLADWRSLRGALIGCLALLKRTNNVGMIIGGDSKTLAQSMLDNVQVQLLAMHDRKLCFKVFQCLLDLYPESMAALGDDFVYGLIQAVDQEKDPRCLILTFHLVQSLVKLFLSLLGSAHVAQDIFEKIADDFEVKREELSDALMHAFCSTPYFEPFAIPLLLDKLSSSLPIAKIDSLKYLNKSLLNFGADRMMPHALSIWSSLKIIILPSPQEELLSPSAYILGREINSHENEITRESLICLKTAILQFTSSNNDDFLTLIFDDVEVKNIFFSVTSEEIYSASYKTHLHLSALGNIFSAMASSSLFCCNKVFQKFFPRLMEILGIDSRKSKHSTDANFEFVSQKLNYGAVYLCVEMLISSRDLISSVWESSMLKESVKGSWWHLIQEFSDPLISAFRSSLMNHSMITAEDGKCNSQELVLHCAKGLRVLATYPGEYTPVTGDSLKDILLIFMSIVMGKFEMTFLWKSSLMSLVQIRSSISRFKDSFMQMVYDEIVVKRVVLLLHEDSLLPLVSTLEVISEIGTCAPDSMSPVIQGLEKAMLSNFSQACVNGSSKSAKDLVLLLDCYCTKVIPWCHQYGSIVQPGMHFTISLLDQMENMVAFEIVSEMQDLLDKMMMAMKLVVRGCTEDNQYIILEKAYNIMLASTNLQSESTHFFPSILEGLKIFLNKFELTCKTKWVMYFFASIVIALRQLTPLTSVKKLLNILLGFTLKGHLPAAQALASLVNKLSSNDGKPGSLNSDNLEEIIEMIIDSFSSILINDSQKRPHLFDINDGDSMQFYSNLQVHAVEGMAWLGKSLLMRGHSRVKDVSMVLLKCLLSNPNISRSDSHHGSNNCITDDTQYLVARSATDAFHLILSDSHACLNKNLYAIIRPLYKQRFFTSMLPVFSSAIKECSSLRTRALLYRAFGHTISSMPVTVLVADTNKVFPLLLDGLSVLDVDILNKDLMYNLILVLSGFLVDEKGREEVIGYAHIITNQLAKLIFYPHMMVVREAAIECLTALTGFPYTRIYPLRTQVLRALLGVLDDKKRIVRQEAVKCYHAWASITSGSFRV